MPKHDKGVTKDMVVVVVDAVVCSDVIPLDHAAVVVSA